MSRRKYRWQPPTSPAYKTVQVLTLAAEDDTHPAPTTTPVKLTPVGPPPLVLEFKAEDEVVANPTAKPSADKDAELSKQVLAPADRPRALLDISTSLSKTLDLEPLLNQIADTLLGVFKQADRCFVLLLDEAMRPIPKVAKARRVGLDDTRFSKTIIRKTIELGQSFLSEDASSDAASIAEFKIRSVMCVPLVTAEGRPLGAIQLDTQDRAKKFIADDLNLLSIVANLASVAIEKSRMHEDALSREKVQKENL